MKKEITGKDILNKYRIAIVIVIILVAVILMLLNFLTSNKAHINVIAPIPGTVVILDNKLNHVSATSSEEIESEVFKGKHTILVSAENRWPWYKELDIRAGEERTFTPFLMLKENATSLVRPDSIGYSVLVKLAAAPSTKATSQDKSIQVETDGQNIYAVWRKKDEPHPYYFCDGECQDKITVLESLTPIQDIVFYPGYNNVIVYASGNTVSALELDRSGTQNFQPLYSGVSPHVYRNKDNLYIYDKNSLYLVNK